MQDLTTLPVPEPSKFVQVLYISLPALILFLPLLDVFIGSMTFH
jgi:hypothetical protein